MEDKSWSQAAQKKPPILVSEMQAALDARDLDEVAKLVKRGADVEQLEDIGNPALILAAIQGNVSVGKLLLEKGANKEVLSANGHTALMMAIMNKHEDMTRFLLEAGVDFERTSTNGTTTARDLIKFTDFAYLIEQEPERRRQIVVAQEAVEKQKEVHKTTQETQDALRALRPTKLRIPRA